MSQQICLGYQADCGDNRGRCTAEQHGFGDHPTIVLDGWRIGAKIGRGESAGIGIVHDPHHADQALKFG